MPVEQVRVPRAGESISEATLNRWLKPDGAFVKVDEPIIELGTDKATQELAAPVAGRLKHRAKEGDTVAVDAVVAEIDTDAKAPAEQPAPAKAAPAAPASGGRQPPEERPGAAGVPSPAAARVLAEAGIKPADVTGTGPGGRITKDDALRAQETGIGSQESGKRPGRSRVCFLTPVS